MLDLQSKNDLNDKITSITTSAVNKLQAAQSSIGLSTPKTKAVFRQRDGIINRIGLKFSRAAIYREKGAGRGQGGQKGSQWKNAQGETVRTNPRSMGKMNSGNRREKPLINPIIDQFVEDLTSAVASEFITLSFKNIRIK